MPCISNSAYICTSKCWWWLVGVSVGGVMSEWMQLVWVRISVETRLVVCAGVTKKLFLTRYCRMRIGCVSNNYLLPIPLNVKCMYSVVHDQTYNMRRTMYDVHYTLYIFTLYDTFIIRRTIFIFLIQYILFEKANLD